MDDVGVNAESWKLVGGAGMWIALFAVTLAVALGLGTAAVVLQDRSGDYPHFGP